MKLSELMKVQKSLERARSILDTLDRTHGIEIDLLNADGSYANYGSAVKVKDITFVESVKTFLLESQTKRLNEALAQLAAHGIEIEEPKEEEEEQEEAA